MDKECNSITLWRFIIADYRMLICHSFFGYIFLLLFLRLLFPFRNTLNILLYMPKKIYADTRQTSKWMIWKTKNMFCWILNHWKILMCTRIINILILKKVWYMIMILYWWYIKMTTYSIIFLLGSIAIKGCWFLEYFGKYLFLLRIMYGITTYGISKMWSKKNEKA